MSSQFIPHLAESIGLLAKRAEAIMSVAEAEGRDVTPAESKALDTIHADLNTKEARLADLRARAERSALADKYRAPAESLVRPDVTSRGQFYGGNEHVYQPGSDVSFFRDLVASGRGDANAADRLRRNEAAVETRDGTTGSTSFGAFIPPVWLVDKLAEKARAGRVVPDLIGVAGPPTSNSMVIPRVTTGSATAIQASENATVTETDMVTVSLTLPTSTIAGIQDVSVQSIELGDAGQDQILFSDLISDYNRALDSNCIIGTGASGQLLGLDALTGFNAVTYTDASPTVAEAYPKVADAIQQVATGRFAAAEAILMHPRRWGWITAAVDTQGRPFVVPEGNGPTNAPGTFSTVTAQGRVGTLQGLPVYTSANVPTNLGAGTNEDEIYVFRPADLLLYEGPVRAEVFRDVGSANLTIRFRVYSFVNLFVGRFPAGVSKITGTGLVAPTF